MSPRVYQRKFDYEEARRRHAAGESYSALAREYGVSTQAVIRACDERVRERMYRYSREWIASGTCPVCGAPATRLGKRQSRCRECFHKAQATSVRDGELRCSTCRKWKPPDAFPKAHTKGTQRKKQRGYRHRQCRACNTRARQDYRERHKVPCVVCGKPALPASEKRTNGASFPRCRSCQHEAMRGNRSKVAA